MKKYNTHYKTFTADYCRSTGLPMYQSFEERKELYSKTQCETMGLPVKENEEPVAFYRVKIGYVGLYKR